MILIDNIKIQKLADEKFLTREELAEKCEVNILAIHNILSGKSKRVRYKTARGLCQAFNCGVADICKE